MILDIGNLHNHLIKQFPTQTSHELSTDSSQKSRHYPQYQNPKAQIPSLYTGPEI